MLTLLPSPLKIISSSGVELVGEGGGPWGKGSWSLDILVCLPGVLPSFLDKYKNTCIIIYLVCVLLLSEF